MNFHSIPEKKRKKKRIKGGKKKDKQRHCSGSAKQQKKRKNQADTNEAAVKQYTGKKIWSVCSAEKKKNRLKSDRTLNF